MRVQITLLSHLLVLALAGCIGPGDDAGPATELAATAVGCGSLPAPTGPVRAHALDDPVGSQEAWGAAQDVVVRLSQNGTAWALDASCLSNGVAARVATGHGTAGLLTGAGTVHVTVREESEVVLRRIDLAGGDAKVVGALDTRGGSRWIAAAHGDRVLTAEATAETLALARHGPWNGSWSWRADEPPCVWNQQPLAAPIASDGEVVAVLLNAGMDNDGCRRELHLWGDEARVIWRDHGPAFEAPAVAVSGERVAWTEERPCRLHVWDGAHHVRPMPGPCPGHMDWDGDKLVFDDCSTWIASDDVWLDGVGLPCRDSWPAQGGLALMEKGRGPSGTANVSVRLVPWDQWPSHAPCGIGSAGAWLSRDGQGFAPSVTNVDVRTLHDVRLIGDLLVGATPDGPYVHCIPEGTTIRLFEGPGPGADWTANEDGLWYEASGGIEERPWDGGSGARHETPGIVHGIDPPYALVFAHDNTTSLLRHDLRSGQTDQVATLLPRDGGWPECMGQDFVGVWDAALVGSRVTYVDKAQGDRCWTRIMQWDGEAQELVRIEGHGIQAMVAGEARLVVGIYRHDGPCSIYMLDDTGHTLLPAGARCNGLHLEGRWLGGSPCVLTDLDTLERWWRPDCQGPVLANDRWIAWQEQPNGPWRTAPIEELGLHFLKGMS